MPKTTTTRQSGNHAPYPICNQASLSHSVAAKRRAFPTAEGGSTRAIGAAAMLVVGAWLGNSSSAWAATGSCAASSPAIVNVTGPLASICVLQDGDSMTVSPAGSITDASNHALRVTVGSVSSISNAGSLSGGAGISNIGTITSLDNSGTIQGGSYGVFNQSSGTITSLHNSGTIQATAYGVYNDGTLDTLDNSGTIQGSSHSLYDDGTITTLNNSGSLIGDVYTRNSEINISGPSARIVGSVHNGLAGGSINLLSGAFFTPEGSFTSATFSVANGATLNVPEGEVANIEGDYTQSGVLRIGASNSTNHGRVNITGTAVLTPSATFVVNVNAVNTLAAGQNLEGVVTATTSLDNDAPSNNVSDNSALFDFESTTNGNAVDLHIVAVATPPAPRQPRAPARSPALPPPPPPPPPPRGIVPAVLQQGLINGVPAATVLDGYIRGGRTGSDWDAVVTALGRLPTNATVATAVGQAMPALHGNTAAVGLNHSAATGTALDQQKALSGQSGGDGLTGRQLWVKPLGNWVDQDAVDGASGYKMNTQGIVGGVQADLGTATTLGVALAYIDSDVRGRGYASSHSSGIESVQLSGYGQQILGQSVDGASPWSLGWQAGYTRSRFESARAMGFIGRTAQAKYNADVWHLGLGVSRPYVIGAVSNATTVTPGVHLDWRQLKADAHTETGAGALSLDMQAQKAQETILKFGAQVQHDADHQLQWLASAALGYDLQSQDHAVTARFSGGGAAFTTPGLPRARTVAELGVGLLYRPSEAMEVTARYDIALRKGLRDQTASVRLGWVF